MIDLSHASDDNGRPPRLHLNAAQDTEDLGAALAGQVCAGLVIYLVGDLGAGKTTLVRGLLRALGYQGNVKSPTYTLIEPYVVSRLDLYHFDFYRFNDPDEYLDAGLEEYFNGIGVCMVEWPDKAAPHLPAADLEIRLGLVGAGRDAAFVAHTEAGRRCLTGLLSKIRPPRPAPPSSGATS
jgi:tRNA threonylcarbamoyladenosine biosynthesis protein TsaE